LDLEHPTSTPHGTVWSAMVLAKVVVGIVAMHQQRVQVHPSEHSLV
jgi:hypothetical protein